MVSNWLTWVCVRQTAYYVLIADIGQKIIILYEDYVSLLLGYGEMIQDIFDELVG